MSTSSNAASWLHSAPWLSRSRWPGPAARRTSRSATSSLRSSTRRNIRKGMGAQRFAEIVEKKSGGKMKVKLFPAGVLGGDAAIISSLQGGTVDLTMVVPGSLSVA